VNTQIERFPDMIGFPHPTFENHGNFNFPYQLPGKFECRARAMAGLLSVAIKRGGNDVKSQSGCFHSLIESCDVSHQKRVKIVFCGSDDAGQGLSPRAVTFCGIHGDDLSARARNAPDRFDGRGNVDIGIEIVYFFNANDGDAHRSADCPDVANPSDSDSNRSLFFSHGGQRGDEPGMVERRIQAGLAGNNQSALQL